MGQARYQVGVFSTAVYEGLALGCVTLLVDLPGLEYMLPLIERGEAEHIKTPSALIERLREADGRSPHVTSEAPLEVFSAPREGPLDWLMGLIRA